MLVYHLFYQGLSLLSLIVTWYLKHIGNILFLSLKDADNLMSKIVDQLVCLIRDKLQNGFDITSTLLLLHEIENKSPKVMNNVFDYITAF